MIKIDWASLVKTLISGSISFLFGILSYQYKSRRDRIIEAKKKEKEKQEGIEIKAKMKEEERREEIRRELFGGKLIPPANIKQALDIVQYTGVFIIVFTLLSLIPNSPISLAQIEPITTNTAVYATPRLTPTLTLTPTPIPLVPTGLAPAQCYNIYLDSMDFNPNEVHEQLLRLGLAPSNGEERVGLVIIWTNADDFETGRLISKEIAGLLRETSLNFEDASFKSAGYDFDELYLVQLEIYYFVDSISINGSEVDCLVTE